MFPFLPFATLALVLSAILADKIVRYVSWVSDFSVPASSLWHGWNPAFPESLADIPAAPASVQIPAVLIKLHRHNLKYGRSLDSVWSADESQENGQTTPLAA